MRNFRRSGLLFLFCLLMISSFAQQSANYDKENASDFMNSNGKIFVVMAVSLVIVLGLFIYLINLDRKINKLEKGQTDKK